MGDLLDAFNASVKDNPSIDTKVDKAVVESGRTIARQIDYAVDHLEGQDVTKALYLMPHLVNILKEMRATPLARATPATGGAPAETKKKSPLASVSNIPRPKSS
jgi:hypothetical protein